LTKFNLKCQSFIRGIATPSVGAFFVARSEMVHKLKITSDAIEPMIDPYSIRGCLS
jgi:hypothetical protein